MGKNHSSIVVLRIRPKFGGCYLWVWGTTKQSMSQNLNGGGREKALQVPDVHFKFCNLGPKSAFFCQKPPYSLLKMAK